LLREWTGNERHLLDLYPAGPVFSIDGAKTLISWDRLALCELVED